MNYEEYKKTFIDYVDVGSRRALIKALKTKVKKKSPLYKKSKKELQAIYRKKLSTL